MSYCCRDFQTQVVSGGYKVKNGKVHLRFFKGRIARVKYCPYCGKKVVKEDLEA